MTTTENDHIAAVFERLGVEFPKVPRPVLEETITAELDRFQGRKIRDFVPLLVERNARESIRAAGSHASKYNSLESAPAG